MNAFLAQLKAVTDAVAALGTEADTTVATVATLKAAANGDFSGPTATLLQLTSDVQAIKDKLAAAVASATA